MLFPAFWYLSRLVRQFLNLLYLKLFARSSYKAIGSNTVFDGIPDIVYPFSNIYIGNNCRIGRSCVIYTNKASTVRISDGVSINNNVHIVAESSISIGSDTLIAENVGIRDQDHCFNDLSKTVRSQGFDSSPIKIGSNVWIGRNASILKGVNIGNNVVVGANSVVSRDLPPNSICVGSPAKPIRYIS